MRWDSALFVLMTTATFAAVCALPTRDAATKIARETIVLATSRDSGWSNKVVCDYSEAAGRPREITSLKGTGTERLKVSLSWLDSTPPLLLQQARDRLIICLVEEPQIITAIEESVLTTILKPSSVNVTRVPMGLTQGSEL